MNITDLSENQKQLRRRILEISYKLGLSHLGSCLSSVDIIDTIYQIKRGNDRFVLSNGHAGIALYVVLEKSGLVKEEDILHFNIHPDRNPDKGIDVSTGSLGQGLPIALGMALANKKKNIYCIISDGEITEGSIWESLRVAKDLGVSNLKLVLNANGWGAYDKIDLKPLKSRFESFGWKVKHADGHNQQILAQMLAAKTSRPTLILARTDVEQFSFLKGQDAHYYKMTEQDIVSALESLV